MKKNFLADAPLRESIGLILCSWERRKQIEAKGKKETKIILVNNISLVKGSENRLVLYIMAK